MTQNDTAGSNGKNSPDASLTPEQVRQIMELGQQASQLLGNPAYNTLYNTRIQKLFQEWLITKPKEVQRRESLYYQATGLIEITQDMVVAGEDALRIEREQAEQHSQTRQQNEYMDQQGFGLNLN